MHGIFFTKVNMEGKREEKIPSDRPLQRSRHQVVLVTVSDKGARGERHDKSGEALLDMLSSWGYEVFHRAVVPDERDLIARELCQWADVHGVALIITTGGTGVSPRDVTPEATLEVVDRLVPGMSETMRAASVAITPRAMISRAVVGIRGRTLIINLPGSPRGAMENLNVVLPALDHALDKIRGDEEDCGRT